MAKYLPILMYHNVLEEQVDGASDWITISQFESQLKYIVGQGYQAISLSDLIIKKLPSKPIMITFDDGYECIYKYAFPLLKKYNIKATIFLITSVIGNETKRFANDWNTGYRPSAFHLTENEIKEMLDSGLISIGSHSHTHNYEAFINQSTEEIESELKMSSEILINKFDIKELSYSYPGGYSGNLNETKKILKKLNYKLAFGGKEDKVENVSHMNDFYINRISVTNDIVLDSNKAKFRFDLLIRPMLSKILKYNSLNGIINLFFRKR